MDARTTTRILRVLIGQARLPVLASFADAWAKANVCFSFFRHAIYGLPVSFAAHPRIAAVVSRFPCGVRSSSHGRPVAFRQ
jgi:hypothetical protein